MTMKEAMKERHTVRKYKNKDIPADIVSCLKERIADNNKVHGLNLALVTHNSEGLSGIAKMILARGVNNYFILAGTETLDLDEKLGYCGTDLILYAQTMGLNTWWVGGMFNKKGAQKNLAMDHVKINGIIAVGYGETQGVPHKSKVATEISEYKGSVVPQWFKNGVEALLLAPTALNKQAFKVIGEGKQVQITYGNGHLSGVDLGIGKYHFALGAGEENFEWKTENPRLV
ncbi:nitroreductase family protein [Aequitasia blattaphilus]|uniref:Nitroreductase n=1 Tax=Aequitasia blattaphilus TaxID=2949332 RepID=A0ABT1EBV0_9FIRM|nr:nitroreductase family protein [Aequitasia blattaphilus]MCP1103321.1 nitroreductase [Aequitasia blattaphilus]MCR8615961.1 nitroreductase [Aequitasia blattaphilus]